MSTMYTSGELHELYKGRWARQAAAQHIRGRWLSAYSVDRSTGDLRFMDPRLPSWADVHVFGRDARGGDENEFAHVIDERDVGKDVIARVPGRLVEVRRAAVGFNRTADAPAHGLVMFGGQTSNAENPYRLVFQHDGDFVMEKLTHGGGRQIDLHEASAGSLVVAVWVSQTKYLPLLVVRVGEEEWIKPRGSVEPVQAPAPRVGTLSELDHIAAILLRGVDFAPGRRPRGGRQIIATLLALAAAQSRWPEAFAGPFQDCAKRYYAALGVRVKLNDLVGGQEKIPNYLETVWAEMGPELAHYLEVRGLRWLLEEDIDDSKTSKKNRLAWIQDRAPKLISLNIFTDEKLWPARELLLQLAKS